MQNINKKLEKQLTQIAQTVTQQEMQTLATRKSDALDFYDLAVWQVREMLHQAYELGRNAQNEIKN